MVKTILFVILFSLNVVSLSLAAEATFAVD